MGVREDGTQIEAVTYKGVHDAKILMAPWTQQGEEKR